MKKLKWWIAATLTGTVIILLCITAALAQTITESYITLKSDLKIGYGLFIPKDPKPGSLIQLHGQGEFPRGVDYNHQALRVHGAYKYAYERKLDWFPFYVIAIQGKRDNYQHNAKDLDEAFELIKLKHGLLIEEIHLTGISQGGQGIGDLIKLNSKKYQIASSFSGVCTILWDGHAKDTKSLYIWHSLNDGMVGYKPNETWHRWVNTFGGHSTLILNPSGGHSGWNGEYGKTNRTDSNNIYNWHLSKSKFKKVEEVVIEKPVESIVIKPGKLQLKKEMFSASNGVNIDGIVAAILEEKEPPINWGNQKPFNVTIDLGAEAVVSKLKVKDGQGVADSPTNIKTDKGDQIGLFYGKHYNIWYELPTYNFKTRYIIMENVQETKKNFPIGLEITIK